MKNIKNNAEIIKPFGDYKTPGPNENVIAILRQTLEEAERGEIVAVAISMINAAAFVGSRFDTGSRGMSELVGAVTILQHDLLADWKFHENDAG
ncbi:MAG TPA: hypothetical protein VMP68_07710 [Candidatus Eisenbacteria bacterium]|nr:hypothetical protein [Candidatus Eisenbacteria bacterium]